MHLFLTFILTLTGIELTCDDESRDGKEVMLKLERGDRVQELKGKFDGNGKATLEGGGAKAALECPDKNCLAAVIRFEKPVAVTVTRRHYGENLGHGGTAAFEADDGKDKTNEPLGALLKKDFECFSWTQTSIYDVAGMRKLASVAVHFSHASLEQNDPNQFDSKVVTFRGPVGTKVAGKVERYWRRGDTDKTEAFSVTVDIAHDAKKETVQVLLAPQRGSYFRAYNVGKK